MPPVDSFLWHDYETFGTDTRRDRPAQFAAIRTDTDFNETEPPVCWYCQPTRDYIPSPGAIAVTGITPQHAYDAGVPEPEFAARIFAEMSVGGSCTVGYNNYHFDDEVTRHLFWRNFLPPYDREYKSGNSRWDLINTVRACYALRPEGLQWPLREDGYPSFKLEFLTQANDLEHADAHDAVSDVRATIALARLIKAQQPRLLNYSLSLRQRSAVETMLKTPKPLVHVSGKIAASVGCLAVMAPVAIDRKNPKMHYLFDLDQDPDLLLDLDQNALEQRLFTATQELPENMERIRVKGVATNRSPFLAPLSVLEAGCNPALEIDLKKCWENFEKLQHHGPEIAEKLAAVFARPPANDAIDPEAALYHGFLNRDDERIRDRIPKTKPSDFADIPAFSDDRMRELWLRYRGRHYPDTLSAEESRQWERWVDGTRQHQIDHLQEQLDALENPELRTALLQWANISHTELHHS